MPVLDDNFLITHVAAGTATTVISTKPGYLNCVTINTKGAASNTLTLYDHASAASGTVLAVIDTTATAGTLFYCGTVKLGIVAASATGTGADYTVSYR